MKDLDAEDDAAADSAAMAPPPATGAPTGKKEQRRRRLMGLMGLMEFSEPPPGDLRASSRASAQQRRRGLLEWRAQLVVATPSEKSKKEEGEKEEEWTSVPVDPAAPAKALRATLVGLLPSNDPLRHWQPTGHSGAGRGTQGGPRLPSCAGLARGMLSTGNLYSSSGSAASDPAAPAAALPAPATPATPATPAAPAASANRLGGPPARPGERTEGTEATGGEASSDKPRQCWHPRSAVAQELVVSVGGGCCSSTAPAGTTFGTTIGGEGGSSRGAGNGGVGAVVSDGSPSRARSPQSGGVRNITVILDCQDHNKL